MEKYRISCGEGSTWERQDSSNVWVQLKPATGTMGTVSPSLGGDRSGEEKLM